MNEIERLQAIEEIKRAKARYFRGIDTGQPELVRSVLAQDCVLDFRGCWIDPQTGHDYFPTINIVLRGSEQWSPEGFASLGVVATHQSVHHSFNCDVEFINDCNANVVWAMTDRLFWPDGKLLTGHGYYYETYKQDDDGWKIQTLWVERLFVEK